MPGVREKMETRRGEPTVKHYVAMPVDRLRRLRLCVLFGAMVALIEFLLIIKEILL